VAVGELQGCVLDFDDFAFGEETESVDEGEVGHGSNDKQGTGNREQGMGKRDRGLGLTRVFED